MWVFWLANLAVDFASFLVPVFFTFVLFLIFGNRTITGSNGLGAFVLFFSYGFASIALSYVLSAFFEKPTTVQPVLVMLYSKGFSFAFPSLLG